MVGVLQKKDLCLSVLKCVFSESMLEKHDVPLFAWEWADWAEFPPNRYIYAAFQ